MHFHLSSITFSDGSTIQASPGEVIVVVGPNNSGKSAALRSILGKIENPAHTSIVVSSVTIDRGGSNEDLTGSLQRRCRQINQPPDNPRFEALGVSVHLRNAVHWWSQKDQGLREITALFCKLLTAEQRIGAANPPGRIPLTTQTAQHPIHLLERDDRLEAKLCSYFSKAFGTELTVHRGAGGMVPLMVGKRPDPKPGQDRVSFEYIQELEKLPQLETQGDGMRSFAGILLNTFLGEEPLVLIDEPEAFLHPPQARLLGRMLARETKTERQVVIATHSSDVLRGVLNDPKRKVRVVRITRVGSINPVSSLDSDNVKTLWNDPLLRYSNILDGLFHERVILCESDSDCRFYSAIADAIIESKGDEYRPIDTMYTHCGGKARMPMVVRSLRKVNVPVVVVTDFDMLNDENPLRDTVTAAGGDWADFFPSWKIVKLAVDAKKPELSSQDTVNEITEILGKVTQSPFPKSSRSEIEKILKRSSPWSIAKETGKAYVPNGDASAALAKLLGKLRALGIYVVEDGELESFARTVGGHGPTWVNGVLDRSLKDDTELERARTFVAQFAV